MSPLRRWVLRLAVAGAVLGPLGGAVALLFGDIALWGADLPGELPDVVYAGIYLGTVPTAACIGLLVASPLRLVTAIALARDAWWAWPLLALCTIVGLADLSLGVVHSGLIMWLWAKEGPAAQENRSAPGTSSEQPGDNSPPQSRPSTTTV